MAFLGIIALVGVIVSHVIVLFDFVENAHERGESMHESLLDAGIMRLRPVMITVGATILAQVPLAIQGIVSVNNSGCEGHHDRAVFLYGDLLVCRYPL